MLEKHHLGQAMDLHYNINGKLLELKGWCEVIQPAPSLSDRSHLPPHTRQQAGARHFVGAWCAGVLLSLDCPPHPSPPSSTNPHPPSPPPSSLLSSWSFFNTRASPFFKCHISTHVERPDSVCTSGFPSQMWSSVNPRSWRRGAEQGGGGVKGGDRGV